MDEKYILLSVLEAKKSLEPIKCGAVIVKDGKVIAKTHNTQRVSKNATAHAEINAVKTAGKKMNNKNLNGATIYCSCEPCVMCLSAIVYAKIGRVVYKDSLRDISENIPINIDLPLFLKKINSKLEVEKIKSH